MATFSLSKPAMPTEADLARADAYNPGSAARLVEQYINSRERYDIGMIELSREIVKSSKSARRLSLASVACGSFLAAISLALCAYGLSVHADISHLALYVTPVSGLAGVFLWGYQHRSSVASPSRQRSLSSRHAKPQALPAPQDVPSQGIDD